MINLTKNQLESIQINEGVVYTNYGELTEKLLAPTRGGGEFTVEETIREIECDFKKGKTKGLRAIEEINAMLKVVTLGIDQETLKMALVGSEADGEAIVSGDTGIIADEKYIKNVTMFGKTTKGEYKKITIYNALNEGGLGVGFKPKAEGEVELNFTASWDSTDDTAKLYKIEEVANYPETPASA